MFDHVCFHETCEALIISTSPTPASYQTTALFLNTRSYVTGGTTGYTFILYVSNMEE